MRRSGRGRSARQQQQFRSVSGAQLGRGGHGGVQRRRGAARIAGQDATDVRVESERCVHEVSGGIVGIFFAVDRLPNQFTLARYDTF